MQSPLNDQRQHRMADKVENNPYAPDDLDVEWDAVVVGTGMGGATLGAALARQGYRVLFLEKGPYLLSAATRGDGRKTRLGSEESPAERLAKGRWPLRVQGRTTFGAANFFAPLGCGTGGTTNLYASQLERFHPSDFEHGKRHADVPGTTAPSAWPIRSEDLLPYYRAAERLYRVTGTEDPLLPDPQSVLLPPKPMSPRDQDLFDSFEELGLHPYRAHAGFRYYFNCEECGGVMCPVGCKSDAGAIALVPALERHRSRLLVNCEVRELEATANRVTAVRCLLDGTEVRIRAKMFFLAAGAFMTPVLLLNSKSQHWPTGLANRSGAVGRNLMVHVSDFIIVRPRRRLSTVGPRKAIAVSDFYDVDGDKLGLFQSVGIEIDYGYTLHFLRRRAEEDPKWWHRLARPLFPLAALIGSVYYRGAVVFATIVEYLPYWNNRVLPDGEANDGRRFEYEYPEELKRRVALMRSALRTRLARRHKVRIPTGFNNLNYGHVCGTCRFGDDPETNVLDRHNKAHGVDNLYVVDSSFFPTSSGTNISLTIAANALRVADIICQQDGRGSPFQGPLT